MNCIEIGIIKLLKAAVNKKSDVLPEGFSLGKALPLIKRHHIVPLAYEGALLCGISKDESPMKEMFLNYCKNTLISEAQMNAVKEIYKAFEDAGIDYIPIKGCSLKYLYPKPEMRPMGDADLLLRFEQMERAELAVKKLGYKKLNEWGGVNTWESKDLHLELHHLLMPEYDKDFYRYFSDPWKNAFPAEGSRYCMTHSDSFIFLFVHFAKHYRGGGIGLRHILDLYVYRKSFDDIDEEYVKGEMRELGLSEFYDNVDRLVGHWFGERDGDEITELMSAYIFDSGSWGKHESVVSSLELLHKKMDKRNGNVKIKLFLRVLFPSANALSGKYRVLKKAPYLLPFLWVYRVFDKLFTDSSVFKRRTKDILYVNDENINEQEKLMNAVGLYFKFEK